MGFRAVAAGLSGAALLAAACGSDNDEGGAGTGSGSSDQAAAEGGTVVLAFEQLIDTFNPYHGELASLATADLMQLVWPSTTRFQPDGTFEFNLDLLAEEPQLEVDPQRVTYRIRDDAVWSDGVPITADDFVFTWETSNGTLGEEIDPETGEPLPLYISAGTSGYEDQTCVAEAERTVVCEYAQPYPDWPTLFGPVLPRHAFEAQGDGDQVAGFNDGFLFGQTEPEEIPSGGWFSIEEVAGEESLTLARNESYWGEPAALDELVIRWITDGTQQPAALQNGEVDVIFPQAQLDLIEQTQALDGVGAEVGYGTFYEHIDFNLANPHLARTEVRRAIGLALDRRQIIDRVLGEIGAEVDVMDHHFFYPGGSDYVANGEAEFGSRDVEQATSLLESAGYTAAAEGIYEHPTDGRLSVRLTWREPNARREQTAQLMQAQLQEAGIELEFTPAPDFTSINQGDFDIALFGYSGFLSPLIYTDIYGTDTDGNVGLYSNAEVDALFEQANQELDPEARVAMLHEIDQILWEDLPILPLFQVPELIAFDESVQNVEYNGYQGLTASAHRWTVAG